VRIVGYARVSTVGQADDGFGLEVQDQTIRAWAKTYKHRLSTIVADSGVSGVKELAERPALGEALEMVRSGEVEGIVVARLDRLARDLIVQETVLVEIRRLGGELFSCQGGENANLADDPDDPSRELIRRIMGAVSQYEKEIIRLRLAAGRRRKAEGGGYAYGRPSFGQRVVGRELEEDPDEMVVLDRMRELRDAGASLRDICAALDAEGVRTKTGAGGWKPAVVARILKRQPVGAG